MIPLTDIETKILIFWVFWGLLIKKTYVILYAQEPYKMSRWSLESWQRMQAYQSFRVEVRVFFHQANI